MLPTRNGSIRLFRFAGIQVYLHWLWFVIAIWVISRHDNRYTSVVWNVAEYVALFVIVLMHEFGHSLACRQVGGRANEIVLWPLGGVAYVSPPTRPGATLWSIAAGPLVNVILFPIFTGFIIVSRAMNWADTLPDVYMFLHVIWLINLFLLIFNMLPIYPLDGGQILRSLLWFVIGPVRSLMVASIIGFVGVGALFLLALVFGDIWLVILCVFILLNCGRGLLQARAMSRLAAAPRYGGFACPACGHAPPAGAYWRCGKCGKVFDTFASQAVCPHCGTQYPITVCPDCGSLRPITEWIISDSARPRL